jgi:two-component system NarL family sensor kinase
MRRDLRRSLLNDITASPSGGPMDARPPRGIEALKLRDVMDSLRKLIAKQRTEEDVLSLADVRGAALAILSHNGQFMFVSASAATLFGYSARDLLGKALVDFASDADRQLVLRGLSGSPADELRSYSYAAAVAAREPCWCASNVSWVPQDD